MALNAFPTPEQMNAILQELYDSLNLYHEVTLLADVVGTLEDA